MLHDEYKDDGVWLRRWTLVAGYPRCIEDAVPVDHPDADAIRARNDRLRQAVEAVEGFEAAQRLIAQVEAGTLPAETVEVPVIQDEPQPNPRHAAYVAAVALLENAPDEPLLAVEMPGMGEIANPARTAWLDAQALLAAGEPVETVTVPVATTEEQPNPEWIAYQEAQAVVSGADATTRALALIRATGEPPAERLEDGAANQAREEWLAALEQMEAVNADE
ncbi:hypothetical protein ABMY26_23870 [Azospirillum sp. HJ39]|uniref:hypothetical protein n=1 Tax=Azospirillum sp. HJ39 TaxID=3159496 RepID=UPI0035584E6A